MVFGTWFACFWGADMESVRKALWFMESRFRGDVSLDELSQAAGISRYHFAHVFAMATGQSAMRYMRGRRLSEAARVLANGGPDILTVALDFGYGSHEAFTRAFRDQFGMTPESVRVQRHLDNVNLVEAIKMDDGLITTLAPPRFEQGRLLLIAGVGGKYSLDTHQNIPALWQHLQPHLGNVPGQVRARGATFGVCYNMDDDGNFDYLAGVEVSGFTDLPAEFARLRIPAQRYAIFTHREHVSTIHNAGMTIWTKWLPESGYEAVHAPFLEYYGEEFDGRTGMGGYQIWIPIKT
jgi:AraC family transcriptional regulator